MGQKEVSWRDGEAAEACMLGPGACMLSNGEPTEGAGQAVTAAGTV